MATVHFRQSSPVWQSAGTAAWNMVVGDRDNFWGFSARPFQANDTVVLEKVSANSDNNLNQSTDIVITMIPGVGGGGLVRLAAGAVSP